VIFRGKCALISASFMPGVQVLARSLTLLLLLALASIFSAQAQPTRGSTAQTSGPDFRAAVEKEAFLLVNQYRKSSELPLLAWDEKIAQEARSHSKDMATGEADFGHEGFGDRVRHLKAVMTGFRGAGENVFMTSSLDEVARNAVTTWLHSPHHLENIRGDFNYSGMGVWQDKDGTIYFTQIFMKFAPVTEQEQAASAQPPVVTPLGLLATPYTRAGQ